MPSHDSTPLYRRETFLATRRYGGTLPHITYTPPGIASQHQSHTPQRPPQ